MKNLWTTIKVMGGLFVLCAWAAGAIYAWQRGYVVVSIAIAALFALGIGLGAWEAYRAIRHGIATFVWTWQVRRMLREIDSRRDLEEVQR